MVENCGLVGSALKNVLKVMVSRSLLSPLADDDARATDGLDGLAILVLAKTGPFAEHLAILDTDERNGRLRVVAKSGNQLHVGGFIALLRKDAKDGFVAIQGLDGLTETTGQTISIQGGLQHLLESSLRVQGLRDNFLLNFTSINFNVFFSHNGSLHECSPLKYDLRLKHSGIIGSESVDNDTRFYLSNICVAGNITW
jgi:hypothetical protein